MNTAVRAFWPLAIVFIVAVNVAHSENRKLTNEEIASLPEDHQRLIGYMRHLEERGYLGVKAVSFRQTKTDYAVSSIAKENPNDGAVHMAQVGVVGENAQIYFLVGKPCEVTSKKNLIDQVIRVSNRNVQSYYQCLKSRQGYFLKTDAGRDFVISEFMSNDYVFVELAGEIIPFDTDGFSEIWEKVREPAL